MKYQRFKIVDWLPIIITLIVAWALIYWERLRSQYKITSYRKRDSRITINTNHGSNWQHITDRIQ